MPPLPPVPNVLRVAYSGVYGSTQWTNVMFVNYSAAAPTNAQLDTLAAALATPFQTRFLTNIASLNKILTLVEIVDLTSEFHARGQAAVNLPGNGANPSLPAHVCAGISWKVARRYRGGHPRTYLNGVPGSWQQDQKSMTAAAATALATAAAAFRADIAALAIPPSPMVLGTVSYVLANQPRITPLFLPYTGQSVDTRFDSQRRRLGPDYA